MIRDVQAPTLILRSVTDECVLLLVIEDELGVQSSNINLTFRPNLLAQLRDRHEQAFDRTFQDDRLFHQCVSSALYARIRLSSTTDSGECAYLVQIRFRETDPMICSHPRFPPCAVSQRSHWQFPSFSACYLYVGMSSSFCEPVTKRNLDRPQDLVAYCAYHLTLICHQTLGLRPRDLYLAFRSKLVLYRSVIARTLHLVSSKTESGYEQVAHIFLTRVVTERHSPTSFSYRKQATWQDISNEYQDRSRLDLEYR
jgi:hypothetical protein